DHAGQESAAAGTRHGSRQAARSRLGETATTDYRRPEPAAARNHRDGRRRSKARDRSPTDGDQRAMAGTSGKGIGRASRALPRQDPMNGKRRPEPRIAYSNDLAARICEHIADGLSLKEACLLDGMPKRRTAYKWLGEHVNFMRMYARAREE